MSINQWNEFLSENKDRPAGITVCLRADEKILVIRRSDIDERAGQWTIPGGHIDDDDCTIEHGAVRELREETGLVCEVCDLKYLGMPGPAKFYFLALFWEGEIDISIPNPVTGKIEHDDYKWATIDEIKDIDNSEIPIYLLEKALDMYKNETDT